MSLIIDILIIAAALISVILGISRGFIKSVSHFLSLIIALVMTVSFTQPVAEYISELFINESVSDYAESEVEKVLPQNGGEEHLNTLFSETPEVFSELAERFGVGLDSLIGIFEGGADKDSSLLERLGEAIAKPTVDALSSVVAAILVFVATLIVLGIVFAILNKIFSLPVLKTLNKLLGFVFGVASAVISCFVIANAAYALNGALASFNANVFNPGVIDGSIILKFFAENGLIVL